MSCIARYVYTYEDIFVVTEAPQCNRMTVTGQHTDNTKTVVSSGNFRSLRVLSPLLSSLYTICRGAWGGE